MLNVGYRHRRDVAVFLLLKEEALDHVRHAQQWGEGHKDNPAFAIIAGIGAGQTLGVDRLGRLLIGPEPVDRIALPLLTALVVGLEDDRRDTAAYVFNFDGGNAVGDACPGGGGPDCGFWDCSRTAFTSAAQQD